MCTLSCCLLITKYGVMSLICLWCSVSRWWSDGEQGGEWLIFFSSSLLKRHESCFEAFRSHMSVCNSMSRGPTRKGLYILQYGFGQPFWRTQSARTWPAMTRSKTNLLRYRTGQYRTGRYIPIPKYQLFRCLTSSW